MIEEVRCSIIMALMGTEASKPMPDEVVDAIISEVEAAVDAGRGTISFPRKKCGDQEAPPANQRPRKDF